MVERAIEAHLLWFNSLILSRLPDIQKEKAAGRQVILHIVVDTEWVDTDYGPAQIHADVFSSDLLFEGDTPIEWPLFQKGRGF